MKILGIDEAGRGPVIGPMVIVGYLIDSSKVSTLKELGVKDSKLLSPSRREKLEKELVKLADDLKIIEVSPREIDFRFSAGMNLNKLEMQKFAEIINELKPDRVIIDTPEVNTEKFKREMSSLVKVKTELVCENYADYNHIEVAAASIIAKVRRDKRIRELEEKIGMSIGAGYPSDPITMNFLREIMSNKDFVDEHVRKTWYTFQKVKEEKEQRKLGEF